jgi:hypothetical protein
MPYPGVTSIDLLRVNPVQLPHPSREVAIWGLNEKVIVVPHQTVSMTKPVETVDYAPQDRQKGLAVFVIKEDRFPSVATGGNVVHSSWIL